MFFSFTKPKYNVFVTYPFTSPKNVQVSLISHPPTSIFPKKLAFSTDKNTDINADFTHSTSENFAFLWSLRLVKDHLKVPCRLPLLCPKLPIIFVGTNSK